MDAIWAWGAPEFELTRQQWLPCEMESAFAFFEDPSNLPRITPPWMGFRVLAMAPNTIRAGTQILYRLRWMGIPYLWRTLIADWLPGERFVDTQLRGPYVYWHHTHSFVRCGAGVSISDRVRYRLPFGPLGVLLHRLLIRRQLEEIFDYRVRKVADILADGNVLAEPPDEIGTRLQ